MRTSSGATAVQVVWFSRRIEHLGSVHDEAEVVALKQVAAERFTAGQGQLDLGLIAAAANVRWRSSVHGLAFVGCTRTGLRLARLR